jgi:hypothetical protein
MRDKQVLEEQDAKVLNFIASKIDEKVHPTTQQKKGSSSANNTMMNDTSLI